MRKPKSSVQKLITLLGLRPCFMIAMNTKPFTLLFEQEPQHITDAEKAEQGRILAQVMYWGVPWKVWDALVKEVGRLEANRGHVSIPEVQGILRK